MQLAIAFLPCVRGGNKLIMWLTSADSAMIGHLNTLMKKFHLETMLAYAVRKKSMLSVYTKLLHKARTIKINCYAAFFVVERFKTNKLKFKSACISKMSLSHLDGLTILFKILIFNIDSYFVVC